MNIFDKKIFTIIIVIIVGLNFIATFGQILGTDAALYATVAKQMVWRGDWVNLYAYGGDWLDKPHLQFWLTALSYKLFGINAFGYKLPSFLSFVLCLFYTYKLAKRFYDSKVAQLATIINGTALHIVLSNFDVRAEIYLAAFTIAALYHFYAASITQKWIGHVLAAAFFSALAIMTKGIFVLIPILSGFFIYWIVTGQWKEFIQLKWWLSIGLIVLFISPELISLYLQFDLHPEKIVFKTTHVSGLKFFFWDSQFGRFFNNGPIKGHGNVSFFLHTTLWAFLPWSIFLLGAVYQRITKIKQTNYKSKVLILYGATIVTFIIFSLSKFQLPHYIIILFPMLAIITATFLLSHHPSLHSLIIVNRIVVLISIILLIALAWFYNIEYSFLFYLLSLVLFLVVALYLRTSAVTHAVLVAVCFFISASMFFNIFFYPDVVNYQAGKLAGEYLNGKKPYTHYILYNSNAFVFEFYAPALVEWAKTPDDIEPLIAESTVIFTSADNAKELAKDFNVVVLKEFNDFHVTSLTGKFINYKTRDATLHPFVLAEVKRQ